MVAAWQEEDRSVGLSGDLDIVSAQWARDGADASLSVPDRRTVAERARELLEGDA